jgi:hypothetical protein
VIVQDGGLTPVPPRTCIRPQDELEFVRSDGGVLPPINFCDVNPQSLFVAPDGSPFEPPPPGARRWIAKVRWNADAGLYTYTLGDCAQDGGADDVIVPGETGELDVVRNPKPTGED